MNTNKRTNRRAFLKGTTLLTAGLAATPLTGWAGQHELQQEESMYLIGPRKGYSPHIGTLLSTMTMMRSWVIDTVKDLTTEQLDYQIDEESNSIGAMLYHLAATEKYYQLNTFDDIPWGEWSDEVNAEWEVPMGLGKEARDKVLGNTVDFYLTKLAEVRKVTEAEFAKRDDAWIMKSEPFFGNQPTNNYCKWFHVCEHESNHRGQMKFVIKRLPS
ncbi:MAG: DinB family protein [Reichenbachiella sp.]|uniref:DinB family protein n=1 Tax=Reichenbachiella sp. TaxID=2184521 RepID=UPI0032674502